MKVKATRRFLDKEANKIRSPGEEFTTSDDRCKKLILLGYVEEAAEAKKIEKHSDEAAK